MVPKKKIFTLCLLALTYLGIPTYSTCLAVAGAIQSDPLPVRPLEEEPTKAMSLWQASILGLVEGLTEYLPVSSTGHLLLAEKAMGIGNSPSGSDSDKETTKTAADAYAICIQAGAIIAVLGLYAKRFKQMALGVTGRDREGKRLVVNIVAAFLPAAALGLLLHKFIKYYLFGMWPVVAAWFAGGVAILLVSRRPKRSAHKLGKPLHELNMRMSLLIGMAQCIAMWPGISRSLATIVGGIAVGLSMPAAVEFSFLLGMVTLGAATLFDALKHGRIMLETFSLGSLLLGLLVAFFSAVVSVKWMVSYLNRHGLEIFGYYRILLALVVTGLILAGTL